MRKDKARDIARGVLPSTARKGARDNKRNFHAEHRSAQRQVNHAILRQITVVDDDTLTLRTDVDLFDDFTDPDTFDGYHAATKKPSLGWDDMPGIVDDRRNADKLGPLISWARATEKNKMVGWDVHDKIAYFKAVLPDSLQGRHALGHVESALDLYTDEFRYGSLRYNRPDPLTKTELMDSIRSNLTRHLSTSKGRSALREFLYETVPVAAHTRPTNLKHFVREQARDEDGDLRFITDVVREYDPLTKRYFTVNGARPVMVDVPVPQIVAVTCDDCSFLRNDPLATTRAINRFVEIVWAGRGGPHAWMPYRGDSTHQYLREIVGYVRG